MPSIFQDTNFADVQVECTLECVNAEDLRKEIAEKEEKNNAVNTD